MEQSLHFLRVDKQNLAQRETFTREQELGTHRRGGTPLEVKLQSLGRRVYLFFCHLIPYAVCRLQRRS